MLSHVFTYITSKWGKWITVISWMLASILLIMSAPMLKESTQATDWLPNSAESTKAFNNSGFCFLNSGKTSFTISGETHAAIIPQQL